ncbi:HotDog domain-containing protein [Mrakia frigida]|uniref:HotDog domain-containing protein n=1 Tax=Mrakia frigida TaxID=29902 RepID=UPI003FCC1D5B
MFPRRLLPARSLKLSRPLSTSSIRMGGATIKAEAEEEEGVQKEKVAREKRDRSRIDTLLKKVGRIQTTPAERVGIPMHSSAPWSGVQQPWSFTFDPLSVRPKEEKEATKKSLVPEQPSGQHRETSPTSADEAAAAKVVELTPKKMFESYVEVELPLLSSPDLLSEYVSTSGGLRIGKLMEHLDSLAGAIAYKHALPPPSVPQSERPAPLYLATAGADRLDMFRPLVVQDIRLSGQVCFVGSSSMEVFVKMEGVKDGEVIGDTLLLGRFTMVARDSKTHKARKVNPLIIESDAEKELFDCGKDHKRRKQEASKLALSKVPPSTEESAVLHEFMLGQSKPENVEEGGKSIKRVEMKHTVTSADYLMHPQERNLHGQVFGGYLMRLAYELSYSNTVLFARSPVRFQSLDEISFQRPVPIGSVLRLVATVSHTSTSSNQIHSHIAADTIDVSTGVRNKCNDFHFTWQKMNGNGLDREVKPVTYFESMAWLEGRRRLALGDKMRGR